jgi:CRP-like cAMP-binding protein
MEAEDVDLLQSMPIFGGVTERALCYLLDKASKVSVSRGQFFFREGDPATGMFVLTRGQVEIVKERNGKQLVLGRLNAGDCFGEMALMDLHPRSASVRAVVDCGAICFTPADLHRLFEADVEQFAIIQMNMGREVCRRLREQDELLFSTAFEKASPGNVLPKAFHRT